VTLQHSLYRAFAPAGAIVETGAPVVAALVDGGGHDAPGPHDAAARVGLDRQRNP
jgi:hypothetical protein